MERIYTPLDKMTEEEKEKLRKSYEEEFRQKFPCTKCGTDFSRSEAVDVKPGEYDDSGDYYKCPHCGEWNFRF
ncbi:MAG: hypothetical protein ABSG94_12225 [Brevinematales bacterium]|jgi:DNA-directed RNA polymerase subunit RPC12/RpoP